MSILNKNNVGIALILCSLGVATTHVTIANSAPKNLVWTPGVYPVVSVVDGDTIKVQMQKRVETIRILGLDTPEKYKTRTGYVECYGVEASSYATKLLTNTKVRIASDSTQQSRDVNGRILAHVYMENGSLFAEKMIADGYGFRYVYNKKPTKEDSVLLAAQTEAKKKNIGVWKACDGVRKKVDNILYPSSTFSTPSYRYTFPSSEFNCSNKKRYCKQMNSCKEANYYLQTCGEKRLDVDGDGVPCETLCR